MGLLRNDMALQTSGSGSSSKIREDKSEEDDDSLRPSSIPHNHLGRDSFVTLLDNTTTNNPPSSSSVYFSTTTSKPTPSSSTTPDPSKILRLSSAASASSWNLARDSATTTPAFSASSSSLMRRKPSLEEAEKFGNRRRPHRLPDESQASGYRLARVGEMQDEQTGALAEDYDVWRTPLAALDEFGLGISLYFRQLVVLSGLFFLCGLASVPSIWHNYSFNNKGTDFFAKGSAAGAERANLSFEYTAMTDFAVVILLVLFALVSRHVSDTISARVDEAQQTAQDYSVCVLNPPTEILDPNVYHSFFSSYGDVCGVTIALNNGGLLTAMAAKKEIETRLRESVEGERMLEAEAEGWGLSIDPQPVWKRVGAAVGLYEDAIVLWRQREGWQARIKVAVETQVMHAKAKRVFVTFNTEMAQRMALQDMYAGIVQRLLGGRIRAWSNPRAVFEGRVLLLEEACEPNEVIWQNFQFRLWRRVLRFTLSLACSLVLLLASYFTLEYYSGTSKKGSILSALLISLINIMLPVIIKTFSTSVELPLSLSEQQSSILAKLVLARCVNTAVLFYAVTNYTELFGDTTMASIMIILVTDAVLAPSLQALNLPQRLMQRFVAPRAKTQSAMNAHFSGLPWHLAERYTEISKTIFVSTFWSAILPAGLFVTSAALAVNYFADRYALFQIWKRPPPLSSRLVTLSRHVLSITIFTHVIMAKIFMANWPFDNEAMQSRCGLFFCRPTPAWTHAQQLSVGFYSVLSVVIFIVIAQQFFWGPAKTLINATRRHFYVAGQGAAMDIPYRRVFGIFAYVPTLDVMDGGSHSEKWLAANLVNVPRHLVPLPKGLDVEENNLCAPRELAGVGVAAEKLPKLFSTMQFYPPPSPTSAAAVAEAEGAAVLEAAIAAADTAAAAAAHAPESCGEPAGGAAGGGAAAAATVEEPARGGGLLGMLSNLMWPVEMKPIDTTAAGAREEAAGGAGRGSSEAPLPEGWEKGVDEEGREVYFNVDTMESQRERPVAAAGWSPYVWWGYLTGPWK